MTPPCDYTRRRHLFYTAASFTSHGGVMHVTRQRHARHMAASCKSMVLDDGLMIDI